MMMETRNLCYSFGHVYALSFCYILIGYFYSAALGVGGTKLTIAVMHVTTNFI
jgi:hypothetical protein